MIRFTMAAAIASSLILSTAFGQTQYSRPRLSPTPTPTPGQRTGPTANQFRARSQPTTSVKSSPGQAARSIQLASPPPAPAQPTPIPAPPPDVRPYLAHIIANSNDNKFHLSVNGKDLALTPFHVWPQKTTGPGTTSTCIDMRSDEGRVYDIDFLTAGDRVTGVRIHRVNGQLVRSRDAQ